MSKTGTQLLRVFQKRTQGGQSQLHQTKPISNSKAQDALGAVRSPKSPIIRISNATFYRYHPNSQQHANPPLFPGLTFELPAFSDDPQIWSIISPSSIVLSTFLQILRGQHISIPHAARSYPYLKEKGLRRKDSRQSSPSNVIQYVGFDNARGDLGLSDVQGAYLSARYESRREITDFSLLDYLHGRTELNAIAHCEKIDDQRLSTVMQDLQLVDLANMAVSSLSSGQKRRARIARQLLRKPEIVLLDQPFCNCIPFFLFG
jgi:ABC-type sugar transport system ATPase subunit